MLAHFLGSQKLALCCVFQKIYLVYISLLVHPGPVAYLHMPPPLSLPLSQATSTWPHHPLPSSASWPFISSPHSLGLSLIHIGQCWRLELDNLTRWQHSLVFPIHWTSMDSWQNLHSFDALHVFLALPCPAWRTLLHLFHCTFLSTVTSWFIPLPSPST